MFEQTLVHDGRAESLPESLPEGLPESEAPGGGGRVLVTYLPAAGVARTVRVGDRVVLEAGSPVVWFTFPGARHDIGRFHAPDGRFTGYYANVLTPVEIVPPAEDEPETWRTTDLFLDVFLSPDGAVEVLDEDELREAVRRGWIDRETAGMAEEEARRIARRARAGTWPPAIVEEWTLERARAVAQGPDGGG